MIKELLAISAAIFVVSCAQMEEGEKRAKEAVKQVESSSSPKSIVKDTGKGISKQFNEIKDHVKNDFDN